MKNWSHIRDVFKNIGARSIIAALIVFLLNAMSLRGESVDDEFA